MSPCPPGMTPRCHKSSQNSPSFLLSPCSPPLRRAARSTQSPGQKRESAPSPLSVTLQCPPPGAPLGLLTSPHPPPPSPLLSTWVPQVLAPSNLVTLPWPPPHSSPSLPPSVSLPVPAHWPPGVTPVIPQGSDHTASLPGICRIRSGHLPLEAPPPC